jgi:transcriptional regulator with XRE-family HTH domain
MRFERIAAAVVTPLGPYIRRVAKVYSREKVALVQALHAEGLNHSQIARRVGISRTTVRTWLSGGTPNFDKPKATCQVCGGKPATLPQAPYTYLLGLYLGDGCLAASPRDVYKLRIFCANAYPELIRRCEQAITQVLPVKVNKIAKIGCWEVYSFSKHWMCLFPQHGPGVKHKRKIELTAWQQELIERDPRHLLQGLLHSDGCRVNNWVNGTPYPRYEFANVSADIQAIFGRACDALGIEWRPNKPNSLSVARRRSVALLDEFVGPKR